MNEEEKTGSHLTRKEARLIRLLRLLPEEQRMELAAKIEKTGNEDILQNISKDAEADELG